MSCYTINTPTIYTLPSAAEAHAFVKGVNAGSNDTAKTIIVWHQDQEEVEVIVYAAS